MQRLFFIIFSSFFLLFSCAKQKPKGILSESKMTELLTETALIDAYLSNLPLDSNKKVLPLLYANLFKEFEIDSAQYIQNLDYYYGNPKLTEVIYNDVQKVLSEYDRTYRTEDSIRNIFVNDSIRLAARQQRLQSEQYRLMRGYYPNDRVMDFKERSLAFLNDIDLQVNAYGLQIPATPEAPLVVLEEPIMQDSILKMYLDLPMSKILLNKPNDSIEIDPRFRHIFFLRNVDLRLNTNFTLPPRIKTNTDTTSVNQDAINLESVKTIQPNEELKPVSSSNDNKLKPLDDKVKGRRIQRNPNDLIPSVSVQ